jgi:hypothetical protein
MGAQAFVKDGAALALRARARPVGVADLPAAAILSDRSGRRDRFTQQICFRELHVWIAGA